jgi:hypothetical protein
MSASPLNVANLPGPSAGPAGMPGAATGIAQQATQAAQAQGPLAGFEALLAAFFSGQGTATTPGAAATPPGTAVAAQGPAAAPGGQAQPGAKPTDGKAAKAAGVTDKGKTTAGAAATPAQTAVAAGDIAVDAATLALLTPTGVQTQIQPQVQAAAGATTQPGAQPDAGPAGKPTLQPTLAQLATAALGAGGKADKAAAALAGQATATPTPDAAAPTAPTDDGKAPAPGKPQAAALVTPATLSPTPTLTNQAPAVTTQALPPPPAQPVAIPTKAGDAATPGATKDKGLEVKTARVEGAPTSPPAPSSSATKTEIAQAAAAGGAGKDADAGSHDPGAAPSDGKAAPAASDAGQPAAFTSALNAQAANNAPALAHAATPLRAVPQTVANLAAQMVRKLNGRSTRFDVELEPAGLGRVDVRVQIDAAGKMSAALNFDNQQAAAELKSRAGELQRAMEQAGFDLSGGLSFDVADQGGQAQGQGDQSSPNFRGRAFQAVLEGGADSAVNPQTLYRQASAAGVDIRI